MKILAIIPARKNSKRVPNKNIRLLKGKPLISWTIDIIKDVEHICDILVSTDSEEIASIATKSGAYVPWLRPKSLATDTASGVDVILHALSWYEQEKGNVDGVLLLQPTSPFRTKETIEKGINIYKNNDRKAVIGVALTAYNPLWSLRIESDTDTLVPFSGEPAFSLRSQDLPDVYFPTGSFFLKQPGQFYRDRSYFGQEMVPLVINNQKEALDIDDEWDWEIASCAVSNKLNN